MVINWPCFDAEKIGQLDKVKLATKIGVDLWNFNLNSCFWCLLLLLLLVGSRLVTTQQHITYQMQCITKLLTLNRIKYSYEKTIWNVFSGGNIKTQYEKYQYWETLAECRYGIFTVCTTSLSLILRTFWAKKANFRTFQFSINHFLIVFQDCTINANIT